VLIKLGGQEQNKYRKHSTIKIPHSTTIIIRYITTVVLDENKYFPAYKQTKLIIFVIENKLIN
jgi:hypothetical protein